MLFAPQMDTPPSIDGRTPQDHVPTAGGGTSSKRSGLLDDDAYDLVDRVFNGGLSHALVQTLTVIVERAPALQPEVKVCIVGRCSWSEYLYIYISLIPIMVLFFFYFHVCCCSLFLVHFLRCSCVCPCSLFFLFFSYLLLIFPYPVQVDGFLAHFCCFLSCLVLFCLVLPCPVLPCLHLLCFAALHRSVDTSSRNEDVRKR